MIAGGTTNTWAGEEKSEGYRLGARQMVCLRVRGEEDIGLNLRTITSEKFQVSRLKTTSDEGGVSELHAWLAESTAPSQQNGREEYVEERPHDVESLKQRKCCGTQ